MNCPSPKCKATFDFPLELFDGTLLCPKCKKAFETGDNLNITDETDKIFHLGDALYNKSFTVAKPRERKAMCDKAQALIKNAAQNGHPKAMLRLGYMYATGYIAMSKTLAVKLASECYKKVWSGSFNNESVYKYESLTKAAARLHIELLLQSGLQNELNNLKAAIQRKNPALAPLLDSIPEIRVAGDGGRGELTRILEECLIGEKKPLFGLLGMRSRDFVEWANTLSAKDEKDREIKNIDKYRASKIVIKYIRVKTKAVIDSSTPPSDVGIEEDEEIYVYFCNQNCSRRFRGIDRILDHDEARMLLEFQGCTNAVNHDIVIREDDIIAFRSNMESLKHALEDLKDYIKEHTGGKQ